MIEKGELDKAKDKLFRAFPVEAAAYCAWFNSDDPELFFKMHNLLNSESEK